MTNQALAQIHFPSDEDPLDQYAQKIFEFKQFYFQRNPIPKVCQRKIAQLKAIDEAFVFRFPEITLRYNVTPRGELQFSGLFQQDFLLIEAFRAKFRGQIAKSQHALEIADTLESWFDSELTFTKQYAGIFLDSDLTSIQLSQNTDAMSLNVELKQFEAPLALDYFQTNKSILSPKLHEELHRCAKFVQVNLAV
jgi:hypothetical protein